jgi:hypothetical protein
VRLASAAELDSARREWEDGHRRLLAEADMRARDQLLLQVDAVVAELRRRVGATFTLAELAGAYAGADRWSREVVAEQAAAPGWPRTLALVEAAAFHLYARGATDYAP